MGNRNATKHFASTAVYMIAGLICLTRHNSARLAHRVATQWILSTGSSDPTTYANIARAVDQSSSWGAAAVLALALAVTSLIAAITDLH